MKRFPLIASLGALLASCARPADLAPVIEGPPSGDLTRTVLGDAGTVHTVGPLWLAGQPSAADLEALATEGVELVIDLRLPEEDRGYDEAATVEALGMRYVNPAFGSAEDLTDEVFERVRDLLRRNADKGVLLHCKAASRVAAVWLAARVLDEGVPYEVALEEARRVGLRSEELRERTRTYVLEAGGPSWGALKAEIRSKFPDVERTSVDELAARLDAGDGAPILLDVRAPQEYEVSHLPGARLATDRDGALKALAGAAKDDDIVVYCSVGYRSASLARELAKAGYTHVRNLEGSIFEWANTGHPVVHGDEPTKLVHPYDANWGRLLERSLWSPLEGR